MEDNISGGGGGGLFIKKKKPGIFGLTALNGV